MRNVIRPGGRMGVAWRTCQGTEHQRLVLQVASTGKRPAAKAAKAGLA